MGYIFNQAASGYASGTPAMPGYSNMAALDFSQMVTPQDQIHWLYIRLDQNLTDYANLTAYIDAGDAKGAAALDAVRDSLMSDIAALRALIDALGDSALTWDVTKGHYGDSQSVNRNMFNAVTICSLSITALNLIDGLTVDALTNCGLNTLGVAVYSGYLAGENFEPTGVFTDGSASEGLTIGKLKNAIVKDGYFMDGDN